MLLQCDKHGLTDHFRNENDDVLCEKCRVDKIYAALGVPREFLEHPQSSADIFLEMSLRPLKFWREKLGLS